MIFLSKRKIDIVMANRCSGSMSYKKNQHLSKRTFLKDCGKKC